MMIWQPDKVIIPDRKFCRYCNTDISGTNHRDICGSKRCRKKARHDDYIKHKEHIYQRQKKRRSEYPHVCPKCNESFMGAKNQVHCTRSCSAMKLHIYHDRIVELDNQGYSLLDIAKDIGKSVGSVEYYYNKYVRKDR